MKINKAYKTELKVNNVQRSYLARCAGAARFVFNWALADRIERYKNGEKTSKYEQKRRFNALKGEEYPWLYDVPYPLQSQEFVNVDLAYQNFFRRVKAGEKPGFPKFKSRKRDTESFTLRGCIHIERDRIKLPRIGWVRLCERNYLPVSGIKINSANISGHAGRWFVSIQVEQEVPDPVPTTGEIIGVDLGLHKLVTLSDGTTFENPRSLRKSERKLKRLNRELSRRQKGSKNREKTKRKLSRCHCRVANIRKHTLHQITHYLTAKTKPHTVVIEDLNVSGMLANHHIAKSISDASFSELRRQLEYKAKWYGVSVLVADRFFPSSKTCSHCGAVKSSLLLSERTFKCEMCGFEIDRDLNAAINLAAERAVIACGVTAH